MNDHTEESNDYVSPYLTHFVGRKLGDKEAFALLCKIVRKGKLLPGGCEKNWAGNIDNIDLANPLSSDMLFEPQIVCFCDIPLKKRMLEIHTNKYSKFGLAFDKIWTTQHRGASPVFYLPEGSCCTDHRFPPGHDRRGTTRKDFFDPAALKWLKELLTGPKPKEYDPQSDNMFLWYFLCYCKFFDETLDKDHDHNYYMEREWRTIGYVPFEPENIEKVLLPESFKQQFIDEFKGDASFKCLENKIKVLKGRDSNWIAGLLRKIARASK